MASTLLMSTAMLRTIAVCLFLATTATGCVTEDNSDDYEGCEGLDTLFGCGDGDTEDSDNIEADSEWIFGGGDGSSDDDGGWL